MMTVNFGTAAFATAWTILAPSLAMPPRSYSLPTMKPVMFWRKMQRDLRAGAQLDEMRRLERRLLEQDAVVGEDSDGNPVQAREAAVTSVVP